MHPRPTGAIDPQSSASDLSRVELFSENTGALVLHCFKYEFLQMFSSVFQDVAHFFAQDSARFRKIPIHQTLWRPCALFGSLFSERRVFGCFLFGQAILVFSGVRFKRLRAKKTQHAKWTAKRVRRGLFGQSLVDFSTSSWSSIQLQKSMSSSESKPIEKQVKKTPRILRSFAQARVVEEKETLQGDMKQSFVPGMAMYHSQGEDVEMKSDAEFSQSLDRAQESINSN